MAFPARGRDHLLVALRSRPAAVVAACAAILICAAAALAGCTPGSGTASPTGSPTGSALPSSNAGCARARATQDGSQSFPELHGTGTVSLYGLPMPTHVPVRVGDQLKIVWRVTGRGPAWFWATGPTGRRRSLAWGPDLHAGSSYHRPGAEWGTGYRFPAPGCWILHTRRSDGQAVATLWVAPRRTSRRNDH